MVSALAQWDLGFRWMESRVCYEGYFLNVSTLGRSNGWPHSVWGMTAHQDLIGPPTEDCALCSLFWEQGRTLPLGQETAGPHGAPGLMPERWEGEGWGRYLKEGMLEAVLLAPSAALGHEVVCPPAAEREKVKPHSAVGSPSLVLVPVDELAPLNGKRPYLGDSAQSGAPPQTGQVPWQGVLNLGSWVECGNPGIFS